MGARVRRKRVDGDGGVVQRVARRRNEDDGVASLDARDNLGANALDFATQRGGATLTDLLARADTATRARTIIGLQRVKGNAHVQRLLQREDDRDHSATGEAVRREPAIATDDAPKLKSAMFSNDGVLESVLQKKLVLDVNKNGPSHENSIRKLQQGLIAQKQEITAGATGFFGQQTKTAVEKFQVENQLDKDGRVGRNTLGKLDALLPASDPNPSPNPNPQPGPKPIDPDLDAALDATQVQFQFMLTRQRDALQQVYRDLQSLDKPEVSFEEKLLKEILAKSLVFVFGAAGGVITDVVEEALEKSIPNKDNREVWGEATAEVFHSLAIPESLHQLLVEKPADSHDTLDVWFDYRLKVLTEQGLTQQSEFVTKVKPGIIKELRKKPELEFLRLAEAESWEVSVGKGAAKAFATQKELELNDWAVYQAQQGKKQTQKGGIDLTDAKKKTAGLLEIAIEGGLPKAGFPLSIESFKIIGLSPKTRRIVGQKTIGELKGIPIAVRGPVKTETDDGEIEIGRNQTEEFFSWNKDKTGRDWLTRRAVAGNPGLQPEEATLEEGARVVFVQNLDHLKIGNLKNG